MKNKIAILTMFMFLGSHLFAQSTMQSWKELKNFHEVMAQTFHPSEEGDLKPIKARATELKDKAIVLADSKIPADFNNEKVKAALGKLKDETAKMEKMVNAKASDKEITAQLNTVHDSFHAVAGLCSKDDEHMEHKDGEHMEHKK